MDTEIIVALIVAFFGCVGTIIGSYFGVRASNKLTTYQINELQKRVDKHNGVIDRTFILEGDVKMVKQEISDLKERVK